MSTTLPVFDLRTHRGALLFSEQVTAYLTKEISFGRVAGPLRTNVISKKRIVSFL